MTKSFKTQMVIISAPSGAGKSSFIERALLDFPILKDTITYTTREMRTGEKEGDPYHFVSEERFKSLIEEGFFVEWEQVHDSLYGTPLQQIEQAKAEGRVLIMDVDVKGASTFQQKYPDAASVFIMPPSIEELRRRIVARDSKVPANLELRLANAEREIAQSDQFKYRITNDDFEASYQEFRNLLNELLPEG